jgi:phosphatidylserine/phosphatidylglycerophosphate/cardiolipin synthase-like enzyme
MALSLPMATGRNCATGTVELIANGEHLRRVVEEGMLRAKISLDIATADFKAMIIPSISRRGGRGVSIVSALRKLADRGVEIRLMHSGTPSAAALRELKAALPRNLTIRRCPRLHAKVVIVDCGAMYLGSGNFEMGIWTESSSLIDAALDQFNALWEGRRCSSCKRKDVCPVPLEEPKL